MVGRVPVRKGRGNGRYTCKAQEKRTQYAQKRVLVTHVLVQCTGTHVLVQCTGTHVLVQCTGTHVLVQCTGTHVLVQCTGTHVLVQCTGHTCVSTVYWSHMC